MIAFILLSINSFSQNRFWVIPPKYVDMYTGQVYDLPSTESISNPGYIQLYDPINVVFTPYSPLTKENDYLFALDDIYRASNGILNSDGSLVFFLNNQAIETPGVRNIHMERYYDDLPIIPVPGKCGSYFVISDIDYIGNSILLEYSEIDPTSPLDISTDTISFPRNGDQLMGLYASSKMKINPITDEPEIQFYTLSSFYLYEITITESGFTISNSYDITNSGSGPAGSSYELEISPNGRYIAWVYGNYVKIFDLQTEDLFRFSIDLNVITGLEFEPTSSGVFISFSSTKSGDKIAYLEITDGTATPASYGFSVNVSSEELDFLPGSSSLSNTFLETSVDGFIYGSDGTYLKGFNPQNIANGITRSISIDNPQSTMDHTNYSRYTLPDQIDDGNYSNLFQVGCQTTENYSNVTSDDGSLPVITKVAEDITAQTNVTVESDTWVTFKAGDQILLQPGFTVEAGGNFHGRLEPCDDFEVDYCNGGGRRAQPKSTSTLREEIFINVFPNPTTGLITIKTGNDVELLNLETISTNGHALAIKKSVLSEREATLDLTSQPNGVYILKIYHTKGVEIRKLIIAK